MLRRIPLLLGNYRKRSANTGVNTDGSTPSSAWISSHFERLNGEFRRRVKTQSALPSEDTAVVLLFSLVASGQIRLRRLDGWRKIAAVLRQRARAAA